MKRLLLITFAVALSICNVASQCNFLYDYNNRALGSVKSITRTIELGDNANVSLFYGNKRIKKSFEVFYYNRDGFLIKQEYYTRGKVDNRTTITFETDSMTSIQRNYNNGEDIPNEYVPIRKYNEAKLVIEKIDLRADTLWSRDSIVYNQYGKIAAVYHSSYDGKLYLRDSYKYDSVGNLMAMRTFTRNRKIYRHCEVVHAHDRIELHFVKPDGTVYATKYFYDSEGHIVREESMYHSMTFSDFDSYGNWRHSTSVTTHGSFTATTTMTREFEYYDD